jgi:hypothetical protein
MTGKRFNRIGDTPIIGAGTYADNRSCAVSATGHGEIFIRNVVAHDIAARIRFGGQSLAQAVHEVVREELPAMQGEGGVIAIDRNGEIVAGVQFRGHVPREPTGRRSRVRRHLPLALRARTVGRPLACGSSAWPAAAWLNLRLLGRGAC